jgi:uncharacterized protein YbjT (DUF2867 family)
MTVYAVTGASGRLGRLAVQQLLARGVLPSDIVAVVRFPSHSCRLRRAWRTGARGGLLRDGHTARGAGRSDPASAGVE